MARVLAFSLLTILLYALSYAGKYTAASETQDPPKLTLTPAEQQWINEHPVIHIQMSDCSPPFEFKEAGLWQGIAYDYLLEASRRLGLRVEVTGFTWTEALNDIQSEHRVDLLLAVTKSPEREKQVLLTDPYLSFPIVIVSAQKHAFISGISSLSQSVVAVEDSYVMGDWLRRDLPSARLLTTKSTSEALHQVSTGKADAYVGNLAVISYLIDKHGLSNLEIVSPTKYGYDEYSMGVRRDWPQLVTLLNKSLQSFSLDDTSRIHARWLSIRYVHGLSIINIMEWVGVVALIALVVILQLRLRVVQRTIQLKESEQRFQNLADSVTDIIWSIDLAGNYKYISSAVEKMRGVAVTEATKENAFELLTPDSRKTALSVLEAELARDGQPGLDPERSIAIPLQQYQKDGSLLWLEISAKFIRGSDGKPIGLLGVSRNITDRRIAAAALEESERRYRMVFEAASDAIFLMDGAVISECNTKTLEIFGCTSRDQIIGKSPVDFSPPEQPEGRSHDLAVERIRRTLDGEALRFRWQHTKFDGEIFPTEITLNRVEIEGRFYLIAVVRDMTYLVRAQEERQKMEQHLRQSQKLESLGVLAGGIAHDFNNILFAMQGYNDLALDCVAEDSEAADFLRESITAGRRATDLVKQILSFARSTEKQLLPVDLVPLFKEVTKMMRSTLPASIETRSQISDNSVVVVTDPTEMHQVLMNLCTNAAHAMRDTGGRLTLALSAVEIDEAVAKQHGELKPGRYAMLSVSDTGPGIEPEIQPLIFDPFFTTKPLGEGTGMGLAVVHGIVHTLGGTIEVISEPGQGARFDIYLPESQLTRDEKAKREAVVLGGNERLMVVDDDPALVEMLRNILNRLGYHVTTFTSSHEALETFRRRPQDFDLVLTDNSMPGMTGSQMASQLLALQPTLPVILCTGNSQMLSEEQAQALGVSSYLFKPLSRETVATAVRQVLDAKKNPPNAQ